MKETPVCASNSSGPYDYQVEQWRVEHRLLGQGFLGFRQEWEAAPRHIPCFLHCLVIASSASAAAAALVMNLKSHKNASVNKVST